jgi:RimJ/RimL family protein N-acetyltransferase
VSRPPGLNVSALRLAVRALQTPRLELRTPRVADAAAFVAAMNASLAEWRFVEFAQAPRDLTWAERFCEGDVQWVADGEALIFNVFERASGTFVGRIDLHTLDLPSCRAEMGYVGDARLAGRGLMREAALAVIEFAFGLGFERIEAMSDVRNERAVRFALGLGFEREGLLRRHERDPWGELCDMVLLARLKPGNPLAR